MAKVLECSWNLSRTIFHTFCRRTIRVEVFSMGWVGWVAGKMTLQINTCLCYVVYSQSFYATAAPRDLPYSASSRWSDQPRGIRQQRDSDPTNAFYFVRKKRAFNDKTGEPIVTFSYRPGRILIGTNVLWRDTFAAECNLRKRECAAEGLKIVAATRPTVNPALPERIGGRCVLRWNNTMGLARKPREERGEGPNLHACTCSTQEEHV